MITGSDSGVYQCMVTNDAGSGDTSVSLTGMCYILLLLECSYSL